jgi:recombinational DNA repair protein (RecF pathway)
MIYNLRAVVLWSRRSREADKVVGIFTDQLGRLTVRATSAARPNAKFAALTEPFVESELAVYLAPGRGWGKIVGGQMLRGFPGLRAEVDRSTAAAWVCEIVQRLTPEEQASPEKFALLVETLSALEHAEEFGVIRLAFALRFLRLAGFSLDLRDPWRRLQQSHPERADALTAAPLSELGRLRWKDRSVLALEQLAGSVVSDHLARPLHVNRFRQMTGVEI